MKARDLFAAVLGSAGRRRKESIAAAVLFAAVLFGPAAAEASAPVLSAPNASAVRYTTAHLQAEVNPEDHETSYHFEYVTQGHFESEGFENAESNGFGSLPEGAGPTPIEADVGGLQPATTYHLRLVAENTEGERAEALAASTFQTEAVAKPTVAIDPVSGAPAETAHFSGTVEVPAPAGPLDAATEAAYRTEWRFECEPGCGGSLSGGIEADPTSHEFPAGPVVVEGEASGLEPDQTYSVKLVASNAGGSAEATESAGQPVRFTTQPIAPDIEEATLWNPTQTSIQLNAFVNAHNDELTECRFVYGIGTSFDHTAPCESPLSDQGYAPPSGGSPAQVSARLTGLAEGTEYSFRLLAANSVGAVEGEAHNFTTPQPPAAESCPNEAIRIEQHSTYLPECRAYEMVSPTDKNGSDVVGDGITNIASVDGEAVTFSSRGSFGDTLGSGVSGQTQYLARRSEAGWTSHGIDPTPNPEALQVFFSHTTVPLFSEDLSRALVWAYDLPGVETDSPQRTNIYLEDTFTRSLAPLTVSRESPLAPLDFFEPFQVFGGLSGDAGHLLVTLRTRLLPEAEPGVSNVYELAPGVLRLVDILPDGTVPSGGAVGAQAGATPGSRNVSDAVSRDGSRAIFLSPAAGARQLYLRIDGQRTDWVSEPEGGNSSPEPEEVEFQYMTPDGRNVFFTTPSALLPEDTNGGTDLYRWTYGPDPEHEGNLTLISRVGGAREMIGASDDGQTVYYHPASESVEVWHRGFTRTIGVVASDGDANSAFSIRVSNPGDARVSPDGRWLAFLSASTFRQDEEHSLTGNRVHEPGQASSVYDMYLYDARENTLSCVSCAAGVTDATTSILPEVTNGSPSKQLEFARPRFLADNGTVYFSTPESLVPGDLNGVTDAYQYNPGVAELQLLSSGREAAPAAAVADGLSGRDVFIATRQRLVGRDGDNLVDLYDIRSGGGFPEPPPSSAPCAGEACRPVASSPPAAPHASSASVIGPGNRKKGHHHRKCRRASHCHRRKHRHPHLHSGSRPATADRRTTK